MDCTACPFSLDCASGRNRCLISSDNAARTEVGASAGADAGCECKRAWRIAASRCVRAAISPPGPATKSPARKGACSAAAPRTIRCACRTCEQQLKYRREQQWQCSRCAGQSTDGRAANRSARAAGESSCSSCIPSGCQCSMSPGGAGRSVRPCRACWAHGRGTQGCGATHEWPSPSVAPVCAERGREMRWEAWAFARAGA